MQYNYKSSKYTLTFGIVWLLFGSISFYNPDSIKWTDIGYVVIAVLYFCLYFYEKHIPYVKIENEMISKFVFVKWKSIPISEIVRVKKFAGEYTILSKNAEFKIDVNRIEDISKNELISFLDRLISNSN